MGEGKGRRDRQDRQGGEIQRAGEIIVCGGKEGLEGRVGERGVIIVRRLSTDTELGIRIHISKEGGGVLVCCLPLTFGHLPLIPSETEHRSYC